MREIPLETIEPAQLHRAMIAPTIPARSKAANPPRLLASRLPRYASNARLLLDRQLTAILPPAEFDLPGLRKLETGRPIPTLIDALPSTIVEQLTRLVQAAQETTTWAAAAQPAAQATRRPQRARRFNKIYRKLRRVRRSIQRRQDGNLRLRPPTQAAA